MVSMATFMKKSRSIVIASHVSTGLPKHFAAIHHFSPYLRAYGIQKLCASFLLLLWVCFVCLFSLPQMYNHSCAGQLTTPESTGFKKFYCLIYSFITKMLVILLAAMSVTQPVTFFFFFFRYTGETGQLVGMYP